MRILLVEDNPADARWLALLLDTYPRRQFDLVHRETLAEAIELCDGGDFPDVVLLDLSLPDSAGPQTLARLHRRVPQLPIVVLTGLDDEEMGAELIKAGAQDYLVKGRFDADLLVRALRYAVERKRLQDRLQYLAHHDPLTALPNRTLFLDRLTQIMAQADRIACRVAVLFIDLDRFKLVNDTLGHGAGDALLREAARRIGACIRASDTAARLGGDEFAVALSNVHDEKDAAQVADKIREALAVPFEVEGQPVAVSASIGIALYAPKIAAQPTVLLQQADMAMYRAKQQGEGDYCFYTAEIERDLRERLHLEGQLREALARGQFRLHYQPQVSVATGKVIAMEALLRWQHPQRGLLGPGAFMAVLEDSGLIVPVGEWVIREACRQLALWLQEGCAPLRMIVNLSVVQLRHPDLPAFVAQVLEKTRLDPGLLEFEISEKALVGNAAGVVQTLGAVKAMGIKITIDDFGSVASSLHYLRQFRVDAIKISDVVVMEMTGHEDGAALVSALIAMAAKLKVKSVAEGVETEEQLALLRRQNCEKVQGYLLSVPLPAEEVRAMLPVVGPAGKAEICPR